MQECFSLIRYLASRASKNRVHGLWKADTHMKEYECDKWDLFFGGGGEGGGGGGRGHALGGIHITLKIDVQEKFPF